MTVPPIVVRSGAATDAGRRRRANEDAHLARSPLFLVADGMGGHQAGDLASAIVVEEFLALAGRASATITEVREAVEAARARVEDLPSRGEAEAGTTLTGVVVADVHGEGYWLALNLGDSRTYRLSDGDLEQISVDHSLVQELVDSGMLDPADAAHDPRRNVITRALGAGSDADPDYWMLPAEVGDRILVCSDGVTGELDDAVIRGILLAEDDPQDAADRLIREAIEHGGRDNVTAVVVDAVAVAARTDRHAGDDTAPAPGDEAGSADGSAEEGLDEDTRPRALAGGAR